MRNRMLCAVAWLLLLALGLTGCKAAPPQTQPEASAAPAQTAQAEAVTPQPEASATPAPQLEEGIVNILLVGVDDRADGFEGRADTVIIFTLDARRGEVRMTSIMRDLYVPIRNPETGSLRHNRINNATALGGVELLMHVIEDDFGVHIDNYAMVNIRLLVELVDAMGGLELDISQELIRPMNNIISGTALEFKDLAEDCILITRSGPQLCNGAQVQAYARIRKGAGDDTARTGRQREVITLMLKQAATAPVTAYPDMIRVFSRYVQTDLTPAQILTYALTVVTKGISLDARELRVPMDHWFRSGGETGPLAYVLIVNMEDLGDAVAAWVNEGILPPEEPDYSRLAQAYQEAVDRNPPEASPPPGEEGGSGEAPMPTDVPPADAPADTPADAPADTPADPPGEIPGE